MALYCLEKSEDGLILGLWEIENRVKLLGHEKRRQEKLAVKELLCIMLGEEADIEHDQNGRPFLPNSLVEISISHTRQYVVVCMHPVKRVGVDIESLERDFYAVEKKALSNKEQAYLTDEHRSLQLAIIWSAKEALYKCISQEDVNFATQIEIEPFIPQDFGTLDAKFFFKNQEGKKYSLKYKIIDNHILVYLLS